MKGKGSKTIISIFFAIRLWIEFLLSLCQIAAISIRALYRDMVHNTVNAYFGAVSRGLASWGPRIEGRGSSLGVPQGDEH